MQLTAIADALSDQLAPLAFAPPVAVVLDPTRYARALHHQYLQRFGQDGPAGRVLLLGMNPGPWGMAQTGVPFGEVAAVRDWMGLRGQVDQPPIAHPKVAIAGLDCWRNEVSGQRLWGWAQQRFGSPERFFARYFMHNYCPLCFLEPSGRNRTPGQLPKAEREALQSVCDASLAALVAALQPSLVVGVGEYAAGRAAAVVGNAVPVGRILHPSPASPAAHKNWQAQAEAQLQALGAPLA